MKTKIAVYIVIMLFGINNVKGQTKYSEIEKFLRVVAYLHDTKIQTEKIKGKTYEIWLKDTNNILIPKTFATTGTCFFIYTDVDYYLVTVEHVAIQTTFNTNVVISSTNDSPIILRLGDITYNKSSLEWSIHPKADVAVIRLDPREITKEFSKCFLPFEIINLSLDAPFRERQVTVYGYPLSLGIGKKISPITKTSKPASSLIELPRFDTKVPATFYLLDDPSVSGFSGGPVFELPQKIGTGDESIWVTVYRIVGIVHGTISDKGGGFTAIVPSIYIKEAIESAPGFSDTVVFKYENGQLWSERVYKNGMPWTVISNYVQNGNSQEKGSLKDGDGSLYIYDEKSKLLEIRYFKTGKIEKIEYKK